jgi:hypothetical protein
MIIRLLRICFLLATFGALPMPVAVIAAPPLETYGHLPGFETAKLSPSGKRIALVGVVENERRLIVTEGDKLLLNAAIGDKKVRGLYWAGDDKVLLKLGNTVALGIGFTSSKAELSSMVVVPISTHQIWSVFDNYPNVTGGIRGFYGAVERDGRWYGYFGGMTVGKTAFGEAFFTNGRPDLYEVDLDNRKYRLIGHRLDDPSDSRDWVLSADGQIAAGLDFLSSSGTWAIRNAQRSVIAKGVAPTGDIDFIGLGRTPGTVIYLRGDEENGTQLMEQPLAGGPPAEILADVPISG